MASAGDNSEVDSSSLVEQVESHHHPEQRMVRIVASVHSRVCHTEVSEGAHVDLQKSRGLSGKEPDGQHEPS